MSIRESMLDKLRGKLSDTLTHRADLYLSDAQVLNDETAKLVIAYDKTIGTSKIDSEQIVNFIRQEFDGKVVPAMKTAKLYTDKGAVSVIASLFRPTRPYDDAKAMTEVVADTQFLDASLGQTWEVREEDGQKYLIRAVKDNIRDIISERRRRMAIQARTVLATDLSAGIPNLNSGDTVKFYDGGKIQEGKVTSVGDKTVTVGGKTIDKQAVIEILTSSPATKTSMSNEMQEYFSKAYGDPNYVKPMTQTLVGK